MIPLRDALPSSRRAYVNFALLGACAAVWLFQAALAQFDGFLFVYQWGLVPAAVTQGLTVGEVELVRNARGAVEGLRPVLHESGILRALAPLLTSMFMHGGWMHVLGNLLFLYIFGDNVEDAFGRAGYLCFYLLGGICGAAAQILLDPGSMVPMVGASGAIAAVLGAYLVIYPTARVLTLIPFYIITVIELPAVLLLALWLGFQFVHGAATLGSTGGGVAYWAHIGGFLAGMAVGLVYIRLRPPRSKKHPDLGDVLGGRASL